MNKLPGRLFDLCLVCLKKVHEKTFQRNGKIAVVFWTPAAWRLGCIMPSAPEARICCGGGHPADLFVWARFPPQPSSVRWSLLQTLLTLLAAENGWLMASVSPLIKLMRWRRPWTDWGNGVWVLDDCNQRPGDGWRGCLYPAAAHSLSHSERPHHSWLPVSVVNLCQEASANEHDANAKALMGGRRERTAWLRVSFFLFSFVDRWRNSRRATETCDVHTTRTDSVGEDQPTSVSRSIWN